MSPRLQILESIRDKICHHRSKPYVAAVFGIHYDNCLLVTTLAKDIGITKTVDPFLNALAHFPTGIDFCGIVACNGSETHSLLSNSEKIYLLKEVFVTDNPVFISVSSDLDPVYNVMINDKLVVVHPEFLQLSEFEDRFKLLQLQTSISLTCELNKDAVTEAIEKWRKKVSSGKPIFHFCETNNYLSSKRKGNFLVTYEDAGDTLYSLFDERRIEAVQIVMCSSLSSDSSSDQEDGQEQTSPWFCKKECDSTVMKVDLPIDSLALVCKTRALSESYGLMVDAICRQLNLFRLYIIKQLSKSNSISGSYQVRHFLPQPGFYMSVITSSSCKDNELRHKRENFHKTFDLDLFSPKFLPASSLKFTLPREKMDQMPLLNVHKNLKLPKGMIHQASVQGLYQYYHYMQNGMNDSGWGCAYRSLQTLFSWFRLQGFTEKEIPSHKDIQTCLVKIGDKKDSFIGSKEWIGSLEVAYVLDSILGISCAIMDLPNILAIKNNYDEICSHFQTNGTPIMIGGSNYAHTILGICSNETREDVKVLVLDPHYVGPDDIGRVVSGKGVGWKGLDFFHKTAFYNLCMPIKPNYF